MSLLSGGYNDAISSLLSVNREASVSGKVSVQIEQRTRQFRTERLCAVGYRL